MLLGAQVLNVSDALVELLAGELLFGSSLLRREVCLVEAKQLVNAQRLERQAFQPLVVLSEL